MNERSLEAKPSSQGVEILSALIQLLYKNALQPVLFGLNPERAHDWAVRRMKQLDHYPRVMDFLSRSLVVSDPRLEVHIKTLSCPNPVGLAAGFDKQAELLHVLPSFGFGFMELGTFTPLKQEGHKKPRLFRFKGKKALVNRMGFNNPGLKTATQRFQKISKTGHVIPIGINIGKGRETPLEKAINDYSVAFDAVYPYADYFALNVSSPNTPHLRELQNLRYLRDILSQLVARNRIFAEQAGTPSKPLFIKVSPDIHSAPLEEICRLAMEESVGLIATNTSTDLSLLGRPAPKKAGGVSGRPLKEKANQTLRKIYQLTKGVIPLIGVGGVFSADEAYEKIRLGASLIQVYTGWIYEGPNLIPRINRGLLKLMERDGFSHIQEAVGTL